MKGKLRPEHCTGAASELIAAAWYIERGYQVFIPIVQQGSVDFVVEEDEKLLRVQVKTAYYNKCDKYKYLQCRIIPTNRNKIYKPHELYDLLFIVHQGHMWIIPAKDIDSTNLSLEGKNNKWSGYKL